MEHLSNSSIKQIILNELSDKNIKMLMDEQKEYSYSLFMHGISVATYAEKLAFQMCKDNMLNVSSEIVRGALLHDIGKVYVSKKILEKRGRLTKEEFDYIKKHPVFGYEQVEDKKCLGQIEKDIILLHHEKLDGTGYPSGIKDIPLYVQIVTVADMYDALTSKRSYKKMYTHQEAMDILYGEVRKGKIEGSILCELDVVINQAMTRK